MEKFTAKTLEAVLKETAEKKGCTVEELTYTIIEEKKGVLGLGASVTIEAYCKNDIKEFIFNYLGEFFLALDQEIEIEISEKEDGFLVMLNAQNNAILIGKNGQTLQAINTVVRAAVNSEFKKRVFVLVDINNYKEDRYEKLKKLARRLAKNVQRSKVDVSLDPMSNDERKVIHQFLAGQPNIKTESEGEGAQRHLVIKYIKGEE